MSSSTILDQHTSNAVLDKRKLLPWWMKGFIWLFMVMGVLSVVVLLLGFFGLYLKLSFYGLETNAPLSWTGLFILSILILKGITSYGLWFGKKWAVDLALIDATIGTITCIAVILFFIIEHNHISIRLEILLLLLYLIKIVNIRKVWKN